MPVVECDYCKRRGRWAYPSVSAVPRFCSSECEGAEDEARAQREADEADDAAIAKWQAEAAAEAAVRLAEQREFEEEERLGVLSLNAMTEDELAMAPYVEVLLKDEPPA